MKRTRALGAYARALRGPRAVWVDGLRLEVPLGVLDPVLFGTGQWFARHVARRVKPGDTLLDLGCGTGVVGLLAARAGAIVTGIDIDARAVAAARRNGLDGVIQGDLLTPVLGRRYAHIAFNPPYFPGTPSRLPWQRALYGGRRLEIIRRFIDQIDDGLETGGHAWVVLSTLATDAERLIGERFHLVLREDFGGERLTLWRYDKPDGSTVR